MAQLVLGDFAAQHIAGDSSRAARGERALAAHDVATRDKTTSIDVLLPPGPCDVRITSAQSFAPAAVLHNQDPRALATFWRRTVRESMPLIVVATGRLMA